MREFKVGDRVLLRREKVTQEQLDYNSSTGIFGKIYTIAEISKGVTRNDIRFAESNWHNSAWISLAYLKPLIGGKLL